MLNFVGLADFDVDVVALCCGDVRCHVGNTRGYQHTLQVIQQTLAK